MKSDVYCQFCGKPRHEVWFVITGPYPAAICDECVDLCVNILNDAKVKQSCREQLTKTEQNVSNQNLSNKKES